MVKGGEGDKERSESRARQGLVFTLLLRRLPPFFSLSRATQPRVPPPLPPPPKEKRRGEIFRRGGAPHTPPPPQTGGRKLLFEWSAKCLFMQMRSHYLRLPFHFTQRSVPCSSSSSSSTSAVVDFLRRPFFLFPFFFLPPRPSGSE